MLEFVTAHYRFNREVLKVFFGFAWSKNILQGSQCCGATWSSLRRTLGKSFLVLFYSKMGWTRTSGCNL